MGQPVTLSSCRASKKARRGVGSSLSRCFKHSSTLSLVSWSSKALNLWYICFLLAVYVEPLWTQLSMESHVLIKEKTPNTVLKTCKHGVGCSKVWQQSQPPLVADLSLSTLKPGTHSLFTLPFHSLVSSPFTVSVQMLHMKTLT